MPKGDLIKVACNFIKVTLRHGCSPINWLHIFMTTFPRNTSEWLLLKLWLSALIVGRKQNVFQIFNNSESYGS